MIQRVGDTPQDERQIVGRFDLHLNDEFVAFLSEHKMSVALTTYEGGKLIIVGPGQMGPTVTERNFERCMALHAEGHDHIWISTHHHIWKLENALEPGQLWQGAWDRMYMPRAAHVTGGVDMHEISRARDGYMYGVVTGHNCVARLDFNARGSFTPYWKPPFIDKIVPEDRCHLNGLGLDDGELAYVTMVSRTNSAGEWRNYRYQGGVVMDIRNDEVMATDLCMPHTPRLYDGALWFLEAGRGYLCRLDLKTGDVERVLWRPGFLRGLYFYKHYAFICSSAPRDKTFEGLPLEREIQKRNETPRCALEVIDMETMTPSQSIHITGAVKEIYDVALIGDCRQPLLHGVIGEDIRKIVVYGEDETTGGPLNERTGKDQTRH